MKIGQQKKPGRLSLRASQRVANITLKSFLGGIGDLIGQSRIDLFQRKPRPAGADKVAGKKQVNAPVPVLESKKRIRPHQAKELVHGVKLPQAFDRIDRIVRL